MTIKIFINKEFDQPHEREDFARFVSMMVDSYEKSDRIFTIIVQPQAGGANMDLLLISQTALIIVDLKRFFHIQPGEEGISHISGTLTLPWKYRIGAGLEMTYSDRSPYLQVRRFRYDFADWLANRSEKILNEKWSKKDVEKHIHAWITIAPGFDGSEADIDFSGENVKFPASPHRWFKICSLDDLPDWFDRAADTGLRLTNQQIEKLASSLGVECNDWRGIISRRSYCPRLFSNPPNQEHIINRLDQANTLLSMLDSSTVSITVIEGLSGMGRTALAGWLANQAVKRKIRVYWIDCRERGDLQLDTLLIALAAEIPGLSSSTVRNPMSPLYDRLDAALEFLSQRPTLIIFDDYHVLKYRQSLNPFFNHATRYGININIALTSCERLVESDWPAESVNHVEIQGLEFDHFIEFTQVVGSKIGLTELQKREIWEKLSGNPQAFIYSQKIIRQSLLAGNLKDLPLDQAEDRLKRVTELLSPEALILAQKISIIRSHLSMDIITELCESDRLKASGLIIELQDKFLLSDYPDGKSFFMIELIRSYLSKSLHQRIHQDTHKIVGEAFRTLAERTSNDVDKTDLYVEAIYYFEEGKLKDLLDSTANLCYPLLVKLGDWDAAIRVAHLASENASPNTISRCKWILKELEIGKKTMGQDQIKARLNDATSCFPNPIKSNLEKWKSLEAQIAHRRGVIEYEEHNYVQALERFHSSIELADKGKDHRTKAKALMSIARIERLKGEYPSSIEHLQAAMDIGKSLSDEDLIADTYNHLGLIELSRGEYESAKSWFTKALVLAEEKENWSAIETIKGSLGRAKLFEGDPKAAEKIFRDCLIISRELHESRGIRIHLTNLIESLIKLRQFDEAVNLLEEVERLNLKAQDMVGIAWNLKHRGQVIKLKDGNIEEGNNKIQNAIEKLKERGVKEYISEFEEALREGSGIDNNESITNTYSLDES